MSKQDPNQIINPLEEINRQITMPVLKLAVKESGFEFPLWFKLYNQIRYYEEFGKLHLGVNVSGIDTLAEQFGVTPKQIIKAYDHLTNTYKLGQWVISDEPIFRRVRRVWVSNARLSKGPINRYLPQNGSKTPTAGEQTPPLSPPLLENE